MDASDLASSNVAALSISALTLLRVLVNDLDRRTAYPAGTFIASSSCGRSIDRNDLASSIVPALSISWLILLRVRAREADLCTL